LTTLNHWVSGKDPGVKSTEYIVIIPCGTIALSLRETSLNINLLL
jgi:hypothetical protein